MPKLTLDQRKRLRKSAFAIPSRRHDSEEEEMAEMRAKAHAKFPGMGKPMMGKKSTMHRMK